VKKGLELTGVQVASRPLSGMVVQSSLRVALGAWPLEIPVRNPNIRPLRLDIQFNPGDRPRCSTPQHMLIEIGILHGSPPRTRL